MEPCVTGNSEYAEGVRVCACVCLSVCEMDSSAFPCLSSSLPTSYQSYSFLDSITYCLLQAKGSGSGVILFHWLFPRRSGLSLPRYLVCTPAPPLPPALVSISPSTHNIIVQLQWLPQAD